MLRFKDRPLAFQIWVILGLVLGGSFTLLTILFPLVLRISFTNETFARLEESQEYILQTESFDNLSTLLHPAHEFLFPPAIERYREKDKYKDNKKIDRGPLPLSRSIRVVRNIFLNDNGEMLGDRILPSFSEIIKKDAKNQQKNIKHYIKKIDNTQIIYIIRRVELDGKQGYLVSFLFGKYRDNLVETIFWRLIGILIFVLLISWIASINISRYLTRPLEKLQLKVKEIAERKWDNSVSINRGDEIGQLGAAIEWMRCQLIEHHRKQQNFLQQVSHELKTPIMVIRSYASSIQDGIFPGGSLESSVRVIEEETEKMEKRVHSLLHLTKLDYLSTQSLELNEFNLAALVERLVDTFSWRRTELNWDLNLDELYIIADKDKLTVALENLLDNQIRYSVGKVKISLSREEGVEGNLTFLRFWNDGPQIENKVTDSLFEKYKKGTKGEFGLGLSIVKTIIDMHQGEIWAANEDNGVAFYIKLNCNIDH